MLYHALDYAMSQLKDSNIDVFNDDFENDEHLSIEEYKACMQESVDRMYDIFEEIIEKGIGTIKIQG